MMLQENSNVGLREKQFLKGESVTPAIGIEIQTNMVFHKVSGNTSGLFTVTGTI